MPLEVKVTNKVKGTENVFQATGSLMIEGKDCGNAEVIIKDIGDNQAELVLDDNVAQSVLGGKVVKAYKANTITDYEGVLKKGTSLCFRGFSFNSSN